MPRPKKPLSEQKGNLTQEFKARKEFEEALIPEMEGLPKTPPSWLNADAKKVWREMHPKIQNLSFLGDLDVDNLGGYCNAVALYRKATRQLDEVELLDVKDNGQQVENPLVNVQIKYAKEMRAFSSKCGFSVDSRLSLAAEKANQIDEEIMRKFGDI